MNLDDSILDDIKKLLGLTEDDEDFDTDIIMHINDCFERLHDLGVGPNTIFQIEDNVATWGDFFGKDTVRPRVKTYMWKYVKRAFDPPSGSVLDSLDRQIKEAEWLLNAAVDPTDTEKEYMNLQPLWGRR